MFKLFVYWDFFYRTLFVKIKLLENSFKDTVSVSNSLDPVQTQRFQEKNITYTVS